MKGGNGKNKNVAFKSIENIHNREMEGHLTSALKTPSNVEELPCYLNVATLNLKLCGSL